MLGQASFLVLIVAIISPASQPIATAIEETFLQFLLVSHHSALSRLHALTRHTCRSLSRGLGPSLRVRRTSIPPLSCEFTVVFDSRHRPRLAEQVPVHTGCFQRLCSSAVRPTRDVSCRRTERGSCRCVVKTRPAYRCDVADAFAPQPYSMANSSSQQQAQSAQSFSASAAASSYVRLLFSFTCAHLFLATALASRLSRSRSRDFRRHLRDDLDGELRQSSSVMKLAH